MTTPEQIAAATLVRGLWTAIANRHRFGTLRTCGWPIFGAPYADFSDPHSALQLLLANGQIVIVRKNP